MPDQPAATPGTRDRILPAARSAPDAPSREAAPAVACAAAGRVGEIAGLVGDAGFIQRCAARYAASGFGRPGEAEVRSWRNSWPPLFGALVRAGLSDLQVYLEYGTPGGGRRLDALLIGVGPGGSLVLVIVELKQWQTCRVLDAERVLRSDGVVTAHPVHQVAAYRSFFRHWRPGSAPELDVRAVVVLHNADAAQGAGLLAGAGNGADAGVPVLTADDLADSAGPLAGRLLAGDLRAPTAIQVEGFEQIRWEPSSRLLEHVGAELEGKGTFALVDDQQDALLRILAAAARHLPALEDRPRTQDGPVGGAVITVRGGPGSGKTALAVRLLGRLMRAHPASRPCFITPSGTLRAHLQDAVRGHPAARELFPPIGALRSTAQRAGALVIDEAQRINRGGARGLPPELAAVVRAVPLAVIFLDERQVIRPDEGTTVDEIGAAAHALGRAHHHLELTGSFRCAGSAAYTAWVDSLLYATPVPWTGHDGYGLATADTPHALQEWIEQATADGHTARTTAGFCWPWPRDRPRTPTLPLDIRIETPTTGTGTGTTSVWEAAWNADIALTAPDGTVLAPRSQLWATHAGGHQQVGCIYTAQGLEYHHAGVIIGPDLTRAHDRWQAHPHESHDRNLRHLTPDQYLPYALNTYRVLLTRGTHTTRIHSTHPETQHHLNTLIRPGGPAGG
ncbi:DNA/RNA helicase domain-containing protein [Streptomyces sp. DT20]|uniref:DNA/RNA helicase domain-containing protein n=1 Tax=Streptomyces sp. DT20 TaxID=3416519 RepID=UPI003CEFA4F1